MGFIVVHLVRRETPASGRVLPEDVERLGTVRTVEVRYGREDVLEPCDRAVSRYPELVAPYGQAGQLLVPSVGPPKEGDGSSQSGLVPPSGYVLEKRGSWYRLYGPDGTQVNDKALHLNEMEALISDLYRGSMGKP